MKTLPNDIVLRPRFQLPHNEDKEVLLKAFEETKHAPFLIKRLDDHIFIKFSNEAAHFWSPQLQLEILEKEKRELTRYDLLENPRYKAMCELCERNFDALHASLMVPLVFQDSGNVT